MTQRAHEALGQQTIQLWIDRHRRHRELLLEQHLGRQSREPGPAPTAEGQILQQLPTAVLLARFAGIEEPSEAVQEPVETCA